MLESNNNSVLTFVNDGENGVNRHCEETQTLVKDLIAREATHVNEWKILLFAQNNIMHAEKLTFNEDTEPSLFEDNKKLCLNSHLTFKDKVNRI